MVILLLSVTIEPIPQLLSIFLFISICLNPLFFSSTFYSFSLLFSNLEIYQSQYNQNYIKERNNLWCATKKFFSLIIIALSITACVVMLKILENAIIHSSWYFILLWICHTCSMMLFSIILAFLYLKIENWKLHYINPKVILSP